MRRRSGGSADLLRGNRGFQVLAAQRTDLRQIKGKRTVSGPLRGPGWLRAYRQTYTISDPDEAGDGTVPYRSGAAVRPRSKFYLEVRVEHEPAYNPEQGADNVRALRFTLRAIVKIAQAVQATSLHYE